MRGDVAKGGTGGVGEHTDGLVGRRDGRGGAPEVAHIVGIHRSEASIARVVHTHIPAVLAIEEMVGVISILIIVEVEGLFDLGVHPEGESQKHKDK